MISLTSMGVKAQEITNQDNANGRRDVAFTNFKKLGVKKGLYAKCVESINFADASKPERLFTVDGVSYFDDGKDYDLRGGDGVLTSKVLFSYENDQTPLEIGKYILLSENATMLDREFVHMERMEDQGRIFPISITCDWVWRPCSQLPPVYQEICRSLTWPFNGTYEAVNCKFKVGW